MEKLDNIVSKALTYAELPSSPFFNVYDTREATIKKNKKNKSKNPCG